MSFFYFLRMKNILLIISALMFIACFSEESKNYQSVRTKLSLICNQELSKQASITDSSLLQLIIMKKELDSLSVPLSLKELRTQMARVSSCIDLFKARQKNPRPVKKRELYNLDSLK